MNALSPTNLCSRREALRRLAGGLGTLALGPWLQPLHGSTGNAPPAKAKRLLLLFLNGGVSQVDTFDPKPLLDRYHGQPLPGKALATERKTGTLLRSPFRAQKFGQSGIEISELFPKLGKLY